jgi:hypothetical protein
METNMTIQQFVGDTTTASVFKRIIVKGLIACTTLLSAAAWAQTTTFTASYNGASASGGSTCGTSYNISGVEPSAAGKYPVFVYTVGTYESYNNAAAMAAVNKMAAKGYIAAAVGYGTSQFGSCTAIKNKASCIYNPNNSASAISKLCSRPNADCSKGIVVGGFSQGSIIATCADPAIAAAAKAISIQDGNPAPPTGSWSRI